jgi:hypothetical protein
MGDGHCKIEVPMKYEDVYVNGKKLGSKDGLERYIFYEGNGWRQQKGGESDEKMLRKKERNSQGRISSAF